MRAIFVGNAPLQKAAGMRLHEHITKKTRIFGVDGGARSLLKIHVLPNYVCGDFDSLNYAERNELMQLGSWLIATPDQDYTDLDKAIQVGIETYGVTEAFVFGATGGRLDHTYSSFSTLIKYGSKIHLTLIDEIAEYSLVGASWERSGETLPGRTLSLLAFGKVSGITLLGAEWPLTDEALEPGVRDGTLNKITETTVSIQKRSGDLIAMLHH
jgi:thiamine pyrophosphokinase